MIEDRNTMCEAPYPEKHMPTENYKPNKFLNDLHKAEKQADLHDLVQELFSYHEWDNQQIRAGNDVKYHLAEAYKSIISNVPASPTRTRALNALTDARMLANQAITFKGAI